MNSDEIYLIMEGNSTLWISKIISWIVLAAILISSVAFVLESDPDLHSYHSTFHQIELWIVVIFSLEYGIRWLTVRDRLKFMRQPLNVVDLLAILPFYITLFLPFHLDLRILRLIRLIRVFRLFKLAKYSESFSITLKTLGDSASALFALLILILISLVLFSSFMYFAEHESYISFCTQKHCKGKWVDGEHSREHLVCPECQHPLEAPYGTADSAKNFRSISKTFWWCIVTMTTVGYGDVVPQTPLGRILAGITMIMGILCIALPTGVIATNFSQNVENAKKKRQAKKSLKDPHSSEPSDSSGSNSPENSELESPNHEKQHVSCPQCQHSFEVSL
jgi:voltage-gated potassium channel